MIFAVSERAEGDKSPYLASDCGLGKQRTALCSDLQYPISHFGLDDDVHVDYHALILFLDLVCGMKLDSSLSCEVADFHNSS